jgi:hypothetical protein
MRVAAVILLLATVACAEPPQLAHAVSSPEQLAREVLTAVARNDAEALRRLALNEEEFREQVWPGLPASRPERNLPIEYVWSDLHQKSEASLRRLLATRGGERFELIELRFRGETSRYATGTVYRDPVFVVRDRAGRTAELPFSGALFQKHGQWKVFSFVMDG